MIENKWLTAQRLLAMNIREVQMLWGTFLPKRGLACLTGTSDCGKSTFLRCLALAVAQRRDTFLGYPLNTGNGVAYYVSTEDAQENISAWLNKHIRDKRDTAYLRNLIFLCDPAEIIAMLDRKLADLKADVIIMDAWIDTFQGNINNPVQVRQNLEALQGLSRKYDCLILLLHHTVKNSEKDDPDKSKLNGSGAIEQKIRSLLELRRGDTAGQRYLTVLKNNYMPDKMKELSIELTFDAEWLGFEGTGREAIIKGDKDGQVQYDKDVWAERGNNLRQEGFSYDRLRARLVLLHPDEDVPGLTWFKTNCK